MLKILLVSFPLALAAVHGPALALGGDDGARTAGRSASTCAPKKKKRSGLLGSALGNIAGNVLGAVGVPSGIAGISIPVTSLLTDAITSRLDCKEQVQAATATNEATRGGVGTTASWTSETRPDVSGSSTVTAQTAASGGRSCLTVTDVIIVNGEETTAPKTMCRAPGASGYTLAA